MPVRSENYAGGSRTEPYVQQCSRGASFSKALATRFSCSISAVFCGRIRRAKTTVHAITVSIIA
jgi:hypothetical protein